MSRIIKVSEQFYTTLKRLKSTYDKPMTTIADGMQHCANFRELDDLLASRKSGMKVLGKMK